MTGSSEFPRFPGLPQHDQDPAVDIPPRIADLATTFPLLYFMLACGSGPFARRLEVVRLAELGRPLSEVAAAYRLPLCLRRIQPASCLTPLPWVPWSPEAAKRLANYIPDAPLEAGHWLNATFQAADMCHEAFGLWVASQSQFAWHQPIDSEFLHPLALYAWHSLQLDNPLDCITPAPWSPEQSLPRAILETGHWLKRLYLLVNCGSYPIADTWLEPGRVAGLDFVPITTWDALNAERLAMQNCLHTYVNNLASGRCRLFAVRAAGVSVATLEIMLKTSGEVIITQFKGRGNVEPAAGLIKAVRKWQRSQRPRRVSRPPVPATATQAAARLHELLAPYRSAIRRDYIPVGITVGALGCTIDRLKRQVTVSRRARKRVNCSSEPARSHEDGRDHRSRTQDILIARFGETVFHTWFTSLEIDAVTNGVAQASVATRFLKRWIENHFMADLHSCLAEAWPECRRVELYVRPPPGRAEQVPRPAPLRNPPVRGWIQIQAADAAGEIGRIQRVVCQHFGISRADIVSQIRQRAVVLPRQIAMYLASQEYGHNLQVIGEHFGQRGHTTVLFAIRRVDQLISDNPAFGEEIARLRDRLREPHPLFSEN